MNDPALNAIIVGEDQILRCKRYIIEGELDTALALLDGLLDEGGRTYENCTLCKGTGVFNAKRVIARQVYSESHPCPKCKGTGDWYGG